MDYTKCESAQDLANKLVPILDALSYEESEDTWNKIETAMKNLTTLAASGASKYPLFLSKIKELYDPIRKSIQTERTRLSGATTEMLEQVAISVNKDFQSLSQLFFPEVIKLLGRTNKVFVTRGIRCLTTIINSSRSFDQIPLLCEQVTKDPSKILRKNISKVLLVAIQGVASTDSSSENDSEREEMKKYFEVVENAISIAAVDADVDVRATTRTIFQTYKTKFPENTSQLLSKLDPVAQKYLKINVSNTTSVGSDQNGNTKPLLAKSKIQLRSGMTLRKRAAMSKDEQKSTPETSESQEGFVSYPKLTKDSDITDVSAEPKDRYKPQPVRRIMSNQQPKQPTEPNLLQNRNIQMYELNSSQENLAKPESEHNDFNGEKMNVDNEVIGSSPVENNTNQECIQTTQESKNSFFESTPTSSLNKVVPVKAAVLGAFVSKAAKQINEASTISTRTNILSRKRTFSNSSIEDDKESSNNSQNKTLGRVKARKLLDTDKCVTGINLNDTNQKLTARKLNGSTRIPQLLTTQLVTTGVSNKPTAIRLNMRNREIRRITIVRARQAALLGSKLQRGNALLSRTKLEPKRLQKLVDNSKIVKAVGLKSDSSSTQPQSNNQPVRSRVGVVDSNAKNTSSNHIPSVVLNKVNTKARSGSGLGNNSTSRRLIPSQSTTSSINSKRTVNQSTTQSKVPGYLKPTASSNVRNKQSMVKRNTSKPMIYVQSIPEQKETIKLQPLEQPSNNTAKDNKKCDTKVNFEPEIEKKEHLSVNRGEYIDIKRVGTDSKKNGNSLLDNNDIVCSVKPNDNMKKAIESPLTKKFIKATAMAFAKNIQSPQNKIMAFGPMAIARLLNTPVFLKSGVDEFSKIKSDNADNNTKETNDYYNINKSESVPSKKTGNSDASVVFFSPLANRKSKKQDTEIGNLGATDDSIIYGDMDVDINKEKIMVDVTTKNKLSIKNGDMISADKDVKGDEIDGDLKSLVCC
ncbi:hypothetical protein BB559_002859 [Furculomyces boomerangus]|uniref:CLASP N-terminal domain-containing protein n=2 Tax=Harpellales TaxID=61421 RepID=A0A2T9YDQ0_9FUNG|nr:hypothetical protein BB559_004600 [Furculomyces boomerangus]PVU94968.1 hypothetical protein BB559_002859 [Furculomyces boomerangus]PVZ98485.1 hypothetical protein BB558_005511 [Smittium angustum]